MPLIFSCNEKGGSYKDKKVYRALHYPEIIVDSKYTFKESVKGCFAPDSILNNLVLIEVQYYSFDNKLHQGQILCNKDISADIKDIFHFIKDSKFPVNKVIPVVKYNWNDDDSMNDNNTYSFCYRNISYSKHACGMAIDINPYQNPVIWNGSYRKIRQDKPRGAVYEPDMPGTFFAKHPVVIKFKEKGFFWGRDFKRNDDNHHFEK